MPLSQQEIVQQYAKATFRKYNNLKLAGSEGYGQWYKKMLRFEDELSLVHTWFEKVNARVNPHQGLHWIDGGGGNATRTYPIAIEFAKRGYPVRARIIDPQEDAIKDSKLALSEVSIPDNLTFILQQQRLEQMDVIDKAQAISTFNILHWLTPEQQKQAMQRIYDTLTPDGLFYATVCSIYNCANLFRLEGNPTLRQQRRFDRQRLEEIKELTDNAQSKATFRNFHKGFQKDMYLFTQPALEELVSGAGLTITDISWEKNDQILNGFSKEFPEMLTIVGQKKSL